MVIIAVMRKRTVSLHQFKALCDKLLDEVETRGTPITITRYGKPYARLLPPEIGNQN
jgi:prevent-host-death family protein